MRKLILSIVMGLGAAFVAWGAAFAIIDLTEATVADVTRHQIVIVASIALWAFTLMALRGGVDAMLTTAAVLAGNIGLWDVDGLPDGPAGYSTDYWSTVVVATLLFLGLVAALHSDYLWRHRR